MCRDDFALILLHEPVYNTLKYGRHITDSMFLWFGKQRFTKETNKLEVGAESQKFRFGNMATVCGHADFPCDTAETGQKTHAVISARVSSSNSKLPLTG